MELADFVKTQIAAVETLASDVRKVFTINPAYDLEAGITKALNNPEPNPFLKAVSVPEVVREVFNPGSFRESLS